MRQTLYPHIVNGPDCACGHRRSAHVEQIPNTRDQTFTDGHCQYCNCKHFKPFETHTEFLERMLTEMAETDRVHNDRMAEISRHRYRMIIPLLIALVVGTGLALLLPDPLRRLPLAAMHVTIVVFMFAQIPRSRRELEKSATIYFGVIGSLAAIQVPFTLLNWTTTPFAITIALFIVVVSLYNLWDMRRLRKEMDVVGAHIKNHYAELRGEGDDAEPPQ